jgi:hypothetical protein
LCAAIVTVAQEPLGGACSTTVIATVRVGDFEGSAFVLDFIQIFKRIITFPVQNDGNLIGLMARIRQRIGFLQEQGKLAANGAAGGSASAGQSAAEVQMLLLRLHDMEGKVRCPAVFRVLRSLSDIFCRSFVTTKSGAACILFTFCAALV